MDADVRVPQHHGAIGNHPASPRHREPRYGILLDGRRRTWIQLIFAAILPLLLSGGLVAYFAADRARSDARRAAADTTARVAERVSAELAAQLDVMQTLAGSAALRRDDIPTFREEVERIKPLHPLWFTVELATPSGDQVLNLLRPAGQSLGQTADRESFDKTIVIRQAVVGGIGPLGPVSGRRLVTLRVPVIENDVIRYVLSVAIPPDSIGNILRQAGAPASWVGVIVDDTGHVVARTAAKGQEQGQPAGSALRDANGRDTIGRGSSGIFRGWTFEGGEAETAFRELPGTSGWTVHFGIPDEVHWGPVNRSLWLLAGSGCAGLVLAGVLASLAARDVARRRADERRRAERALTASEQRLATAVDAADLGTWRWEADGDVLYLSQRCAALLGLDAQAPDQRAGCWSSLVAQIHPGDRARFGAAVERCVGQAGLLDIEFRVRYPLADRPAGWVQMTGRRQDGPGQVAAGLQGVLADVSAYKEAEDERLDLLRRLAQAQEDERRRISRELHDQVGQTVTGLALGLKALEASLEGDGPAARDRASRVGWLRTLAAEIGRDIHRAAADLRPAALDDLGIDKALEALASDWGDRYGVRVDVQLVGDQGARLPPELEIVVYRVVQEALTNVLKHAGARGVSVVLDHAATLFRVIVEDDGKGFDAKVLDRTKRATSRFGLSGMRERLARIGGTMMIESTPGAGTSVFIHIPLAATSGRHAA